MRGKKDTPGEYTADSEDSMGVRLRIDVTDGTTPGVTSLGRGFQRSWLWHDKPNAGNMPKLISNHSGEPKRH